MGWNDPARTGTQEEIDEHVRRAEAHDERHYEQQGTIRDLAHEIETIRLINSVDEDAR